MSRFRDVAVRVRAAARRLSPQQLVLVGFLSYLVAGMAALSLPCSQMDHVGVVDNLFMSVSALSTTGLVTVSTADSYTWFGQVVLLILMQLGGVGYMVVSSFVILARRQGLGPLRQGVLNAQFSLPAEFPVRQFVRHLCTFTLLIEAAGAIVLYVEFRALDVPNALWQAVFHSVSAFCTAGFSLFNDSMMRFSGSAIVCTTMMLLCYLGAVGFIVLTDIWLCLRYRPRRLTFTSRIILAATALVFVTGTAMLCALEPTLRPLPAGERLLAAAFQICQASSTAGFNSVDPAKLSESALLVLTMTMIIGSAPSGTGGGLKSTTVSALMAAAWSTLRGRRAVTLLGHEIPAERLLAAITNATLYLASLALGLFVISMTDSHSLIEQVFECASALGTVGLSLGITGNVDTGAKLVLVALMFTGRVGPLTAGVAFFGREQAVAQAAPRGDLCV